MAASSCKDYGTLLGGEENFSGGAILLGSAPNVEGSLEQQRQVASQWFAIKGGIVLCVYLGVGVLFYATVGGLRVLDAVYLCIVTITTVGFGDVHSDKEKGDAVKLFACFYILVGIGLVVNFLSFLVGSVLEKQEKAIFTAFTHLAKVERDGEAVTRDHVERAVKMGVRMFMCVLSVCM